MEHNYHFNLRYLREEHNYYNTDKYSQTKNSHLELEGTVKRHYYIYRLLLTSFYSIYDFYYHLKWKFSLEGVLCS